MVKAVDSALTDKAEGSDDRKLETTYIWTSLSAEDYRPKDNKGTVAEGMEKTGGYVGTDLDDEDQNIQMAEELDSFAAQHLKILVKRRRQLREQILCADNCSFEKWSYITGVSLSEQCPVDCPVYQLQGALDHANSQEALMAFQNSPEILNNNNNKKELSVLDSKVDKQEQQLI